MRITFLGGASEVGASSSLVEIGERRVLVDCGIRMHGDPLPNLDALSGGGLDAVFVTHAHVDHAGALPLLHQHFPGVPIYATAPTVALLEILLRDSVKIMNGRQREEASLPLFSGEQVESTLRAIRPVGFEQLVQPFADLSATYTSAGHILGAGSVTLASREGSVVVTGDIHGSDQLTVPRLMVPRTKPTAVVVEATYGDRLHADRATQEEALVREVARVIEGGGKVLIPAFAVGRAQEVILLLLQAFQKKKVTPFPVHVDGMVRAACEAYSRFPAYVTARLRRLIERHGDPFFGASDLVRPVRDPAERQKILDGPPCCIVSSSGMLTGGPSQAYARQLAGDARNLIAITGYQDEESPGRALLDLASAAPEERHLTIGGERVPVLSAVSRYSLSAHVDSGQIVSLVGALKAREAVLVHGDPKARTALADKLLEERAGSPSVPANGDCLELGARRRSRGAVGAGARVGIGRGELDAAGVAQLHGNVLASHGPRRAWSARELAEVWFGSEGVTPEREQQVQQLALESGAFASDSMRPYLLRAVTVEEKKTPPEHLEMSAMAARIDEHLPPSTGLYHKAIHQEERRIVLSFHFPLVALLHHADAIGRAAAGTGWTLEVKPLPHTGELARLAQERVREHGLTPTRAPSVHLEERRVVISVAETSEAAAGARFASFKEETGFHLEVKGAAATASRTSAISSTGRLEINAAFAWIETAFADAPGVLRKKSKKARAGGDVIELRFLTPQVAARYAARVSTLSAQVGWPIEVYPEADKHALSQMAHALLRELGVAGDPSYPADGGRLVVRVSRAPSAEEATRLRAEVLERTGYALEIVAPVRSADS